jgi:hypothetical protein
MLRRGWITSDTLGAISRNPASLTFIHQNEQVNATLSDPLLCTEPAVSKFSLYELVTDFGNLLRVALRSAGSRR